MTITCSNPECRADNAANSKFCVECGTPLPSQKGMRGQQKSQHVSNTDGTYAEGKTPIVSTILSLLVVGLGQLYNGDVKKGLVMFAAAVVLGAVSLTLGWFAVAIYSAYDAYQVAEGKKPLWV